MSNSKPAFKSIIKPSAEPKYLSHYHCDYIELLALVSKEHETISTVYERIFDGGNDETGTEDFAQDDDKRNSLIDGWFSLLKIRSQRYGDYYPFEFTDETSFKIKSDIIEKQKIYIFFLIASALANSNHTPAVTSSFELIAKSALSGYLSGSAQCHVFGASNANNNVYKGLLLDKVKKLASDIECQIKIKDSDINEHNIGDSGVDIVAWVVFGDDSCKQNIQVYLCQSAAGKNWKDKQNSMEKLKNLISFPRATHNVIFIPYDARNESGNFAEQMNITADLIFDRLRIIKLLSNNILSTDDFAVANKLVNNAILFEEDIV